jgi:hypothetical protein
VTAIHYFQRYSQKENVITNNTLLLLSRLQAHDPRALGRVLNALLESEGEELRVGVQFSQQTGAPKSIPDGMLCQQAFRVLLETKRDAKDFEVGQLLDHLAGFKREETRVLLLLSPTEAQLSAAARKEMQQRARERVGLVRIVPKTFSDLVNACEDDAALARDPDVLDLIDDYRRFCAESGLLPDGDDTMLAVSCGATFEENEQLRLYYDPVDRSHRKHRLLAIYRDKAIRLVGEVRKIVAVDLVNGKLTSKDSTEPVTAGEQERIREAMRTGEEEHGWPVSKGHNFWLVDTFWPTEAKKTSKGPMRGRQYFNIRDALGLGARERLPPVEEIANRLRAYQW